MVSKSITKSKILYLTYHPQIGGGEIALLSLITNLDKKNFTPIVIIPSHGQLYEKLKKEGVKTRILPLSGYLSRFLFIPGVSPLGIYRFYKLLKKIKPDLIHVNHLNLIVYAGITSKLLKIPLVATSHGSWDTIYFYQDLLTYLFVDKIITSTTRLREQLLDRKIINSKKIITIPFGIDTTIFKPLAEKQKVSAKKALGLKTSDIVITIVGRLDPQKDHLTFLKAANLISKKVKNIRFLVVGSKKSDFSKKGGDYYSQLKAYIESNHRLKENVIFTGFREDMQEIYGATDILVSTSTSESFALALLEGAACGLPIVSTNVGNQSSIVQNDWNGYLVSPKNPRLIANKVFILIKDKTLRKNFGIFGRTLVLKRFPLGNYIKSTQNIYSKLT